MLFSCPLTFFTASKRLCLFVGCFFFAPGSLWKTSSPSSVTTICFLSVDFFLDPWGTPLGAAWLTRMLYHRLALLVTWIIMHNRYSRKFRQNERSGFSECAPMIRSESIWTYTFNIMMTFNLDWNYCALFPLVNPKWRYSVLCKSACYTRQFHVQCTCTLYSFPSDFFDHPLLPLQCKVSVVFKGTLHWIPLRASI